MLRLSRERVLIALGPETLALARLGPGKGKARRAVDVRVLAYDATLGVESWQAAVDALGGVAADLSDTSCDVTVVLSNHFVRYALVPASEGLERNDEELAYARYCFARIHGARSKAWDVRMSAASKGEERMASAIDATLLAAIASAFPAGGKARLASVQPYLMSAYNRWRRDLQGAAWLLLVEPQRYCLAHLDGGRWVSVRNTKGEMDDPAHWAELLHRERHLVGAAEAGGRVYVHAPHGIGPGALPGDDWQFHPLAEAPLAGVGDSQAAPLAMALCAA